MSPLALYAFYGILIAIAAIVSMVAMEAGKRLLRRRAAFQRLHSSPANANDPVSLRRAAPQINRRDPIGRVEQHARQLMVQSGNAHKPGMLAAVAIVAAAIGFFVADRALGNLAISSVLALVLAVAAPYVMLAHAREQRRNAFVAQLPAVMDILVRSLRAGHPLTVAVSMVGRDMASPAAEEFTLCAHEMNYGLDLQSAINNVAARVGAAEASVMASAISIQQRTGGNLTEVLQRLATLLRERAKLRAKARALSAEGRYSGLFLSALPFLMFAFLTVANPDYYGGVQDNPLVPIILAATGVWMAIGIFIIQRMVNFKP